MEDFWCSFELCDAHSAAIYTHVISTYRPVSQISNHVHSPMPRWDISDRIIRRHPNTSKYPQNSCDERRATGGNAARQKRLACRRLVVGVIKAPTDGRMCVRTAVELDRIDRERWWNEARPR